jgi:peptidyl-prolyl cis-trans isomerase A (cyclophilin A)/peptidyl-prolyl cis-trans isomerase B (cyclophilin B)
MPYNSRAAEVRCYIALEHPLQRSRMKLKHLFILSVAAVPGGALAADPQVDIRTNVGTIRLELYPEKAPKSVENFLQYVKDGHYSGTVFHRVIDGFMIQGGGFDKSYNQKPTRDPIQNEAKNGLKNDVGSIAMARTSAPHSASAQFFINVKSNDFLNYPGQDGWGYAVFGKVVSGMDVVTKIAKTPTGAAGPFRSDVPTQPVLIESMTVVGAKK